MEPKKTLKSTEKKTVAKKAKVISPVKKVAPRVSSKLLVKKMVTAKTKVNTNKKTSEKKLKPTQNQKLIKR